MKRKLAIYGLVLCFCFLPVAVGLTRPDFSGNWVLDKNRSFSNPPGLEQTLNVTHTGDQIKLDSKLVTARGEQSISESYTLDGKERDFVPAGAQPGTKGKRSAVWLPDGRGILISDEITSDSPTGPVTQKIARKWTLSANGSTLTVDYFFDNPGGVSYEAKRVFVKK
ncbi:MAG TPA: hypothetical protein VNS63_10595 [Blastocatellia bacterium]|nr:hypothetical protein [Blastocatellia bacterium]